jgi:hypothetical protein
MDLKVIGCENLDLVQSIQDRAQWRALAGTIANLLLVANLLVR